MTREAKKNFIVDMVLATMGIKNDGSITFEDICNLLKVTEKEAFQAFAEGMKEALNE